MTSSASTTNREGSANYPHAMAAAREAYSEVGLLIDDLLSWSEALGHIALSPNEIGTGVVRVIASAINTACHGLDAERDTLGRLALGMTAEQQLDAHRARQMARAVGAAR